MKITPIKIYSQPSPKVVVPNSGANKNVQYMYNKVLSVVKENHLLTNIKNDGIEIFPHKSAENKLFESLKNLGINFTVNTHK